MSSIYDRLDFGPGLDVSARSRAGAHAGVTRENQDNLLLIDTRGQAVHLRDQHEQFQQVPGWPAGHARLAVLDGMGGHGHGREAAEAVAAGLLSIPACATLGELSAQLDALHSTLQHYFSVATDGENSRHPGTTLTMLELRPGQPPMLYHVGDSRLYEITPNQVSPMTVDHVPATAFAMAGMLSEQEWWQQVHGEHRSQISQAFILGNTFFSAEALSAPLCELSPVNLPSFLYHLADRRAFELRPGALYLLATDGFWACADPYEWVGRWPELLAGDGQSAGAAIAALFDAMERHPPANLHIDNITAIALRLRP